MYEVINKMDKNTFSLTNNTHSFFIYKPFELDDPNVILVIVHGLAEHNERYMKLCGFMFEHNIQTYAISLLGHGKYDLNLGTWPKNGFDVCVDDLDVLIDYIIKKHKNKKIVLFGHSMGSFIALSYIEKHGNKVDLCILSGSNDKQPKLLTVAGTLISSLICTISGRDKQSKLLNNMSFGSFNSHFKPNKSEFDWLSKDENEVRKYVEDPLCGFIPSAGMFNDLLKGLNTIYLDSEINSIPKTLPIHILGGGDDPVGNFGKGLKALKERLIKANIKKVTLEIYENNRHECLNETNSTKVMTDILNLII